MENIDNDFKHLINQIEESTSPIVNNLKISSENLELICISIDKSNFELDSKRKSTKVTDVTNHTEYLKSLYLSSPHNDLSYFQYYLLEKQNRFVRYSNRLANDPAFNDTQITLSFLDDGDLHGDFSIYLLLDKSSHSVLYSCRVFGEIKDVKAEVSGGKSIEEINKESVDDYTFQMQKSAVLYADTVDDTCVVFDRLSGKRPNYNSDFANCAKCLLYKFFLKTEYNKGKRRLICLARQEKGNRLLHGYVNLGLELKGITNYLIGDKDISHWLLSRDIEKFMIHANRYMKIHSLFKNI